MHVRIVPQNELGTVQSAITASGSREENCSSLRTDTEAIDRLELPRRHRPLRDLLMAVNGGGSIFASTYCAVRAEEPAQGPDVCKFISRVGILFAKHETNLDQREWELVAHRIEKLLARDGGNDSIYVQLCIAPAGGADPAAYALDVIVEARGSTLAQAELRWALALARIQQALLFTSRSLRQQTRFESENRDSG